MFVIIPFLLVLSGDTDDIIRSMCILPTSLMLGVFGISHLALLISFPEMNDGDISGKALLLFLIFLLFLLQRLILKPQQDFLE